MKNHPLSLCSWFGSTVSIKPARPLRECKPRRSLRSSFHFLVKSSRFSEPEMANQETILEDGESNKGLVLTLYDALSSRDVATVHRLVASDLEWWFHGPPSHQFLMRLLTGADDSESGDSSSFAFVPQSIIPFDSLVIAEGCIRSRSIFWVHAWTVSDGIITHVREYLNTSITVTRLGTSTNQSSPSGIASSSSSISSAPSHRCQPVWESGLSKQFGKSVPGLVLAL
ncbi:hypothetical protein Nepgr_006902 [Nepenthes gracilis]|uniref:Wound-induced protein 1 n=1 Tax=Nepenthes gracilis TaxID=150966 RepID=A0AAD3S5W4_NEPGR|nr:hypothetical protein Nepgr_006902 [Nepenthes gracilis]